MPASALAPLQPTVCGGMPPLAGLPAVSAIVADEGGTQARRYRDRQKNFSILLPWNWKVQEKNGALIDLVASPTEDDTKPRVSLAVISADLPRPIQPSLYFDFALQIVQAHLPNAKVMHQGSTSSCATVAYWALIDYYPASERPTLLLQYYFFAPDGKRIYTLSISADKAYFTQYQPLFDSIVHSFRQEYPPEFF